MWVEARTALLRWFEAHKRDLPWRRMRDPYAIWISETMLQQTRVAAVLEHYSRWMRQLPTVHALAGAGEPEVLALWSGLGYYRRARMLHRAAQVVVEKHAGALPRTAPELLTLPGIGAYTSAAVASIAFGEPVAVVDGNVERVMARLLGLAAPAPIAIRAGAESLLDRERPGDANQAVMELGATICLPKAPLCLGCPVQSWCCTRGEHPVAPRKPLVTRMVRYALLTRDGDAEVLLRQRPAEVSLMAGMWELPEVSESTEGAELLRVRHSITVTNYLVSVARLDGEHGNALPGPRRWVRIEELPGLPLTGLARKVLRKLKLWPDAEVVSS